MACGTPVIAYRRGSVEEVVEDGRTGYIVDNERQAVEAILRIAHLDRRECRAAFEERFTAERMASEYLQIYRELCVKSESGGPRKQAALYSVR